MPSLRAVIVVELSQRVCQGTVRSYEALTPIWRSTGPDVRLHSSGAGSQRAVQEETSSTRYLTALILSILGKVLMQILDKHEWQLLWAACYLGFFAFMRSGELSVVAGERFDPTRHLTPRDVT